MTVREELNKKKKLVSLITFGGIAIVLGDGILAGMSDRFPYVSIVFALVVAVLQIYLFFGARCPQCKEGWGHIIMNAGGPFSISKKIKFCPFCGLSIDSDTGKPYRGLTTG